MATYEITGPKGEVYHIEGADGADPSAIIAQLSGQAQGPQQPAAAPVDNSWAARGRTALNRLNAGALDIAGLAGDTVENLGNLGRAAVGSAYLATGHDNPDWTNIPDPANEIGTSAWFKKQAQQHLGTQTGNVDSRDPVQRYGGTVLEAAPSLAIDQPETMTWPQLVRNAAGLTTGAVAQQGAADAGLSPGVQAVAGFAGSHVPAVAEGAPGAITRAALGVKNENVPKYQQAQQEASNAGVKPNAQQVVGSGQVNWLQSLFQKVPGSAGAIAKQFQQQASEAAAKIHDIAVSLSTRVGNSAAGSAIDKGIQQSFMDRTEATTKRLYDTFDNLLPGDTRVDISNYKAAVDAASATIPGAKAQSELLNQDRNPFGVALRGRLYDDLKEQSLVDLAEKNGVSRDAIKATTQPGRDGYVIPAQGNTPEQFVPIADWPHAVPPGWKRVQEPSVQGYTIPTDNGPKFVAHDDVPLATTLPFSTLRGLRTAIGGKMDAGALTLAPRDASLASLYAGLSKDMEGAAEAAGPEAAQAYSRANTYYSARMARQDVLQKVINANGGPEGIFNAAIQGSKDGDFTLHKVMQSLPAAEQRTVSATMLDKMGRVSPGKQNGAGDLWSFDTFLTNYGKISSAARGELFGRIDPEYQRSIDSLVSLASRNREGAKVYSNSSGTAPAEAQIYAGDAAASAAGRVAGQVAHGAVGAAAATAGKFALPFVIARMGAKAMANQTVVKWLATAHKFPESSTPALVANLAQQAQANKDPETANIATLLKQAYAQRQLAKMRQASQQQGAQQPDAGFAGPAPAPLQ